MLCKLDHTLIPTDSRNINMVSYGRVLKGGQTQFAIQTYLVYLCSPINLSINSAVRQDYQWWFDLSVYPVVESCRTLEKYLGLWT